MRTFIFGAGASVHAGYPLASALWPSLQTWGRQQNFEPIDYCAGAVDSLNKAFDTSLPFELLLTELDKRINSPRDSVERACLPVLRGQIQTLVCRFFDSVRLHDAALYASFARNVLAPGDTVITFNYDVSLDRELQRSGKWSVADGYGFALDASCGRSPSVLLKLHGSTNWIGQIFDGLAPGKFSMGPSIQPSLGRRPVIPTPDRNYLGANLVDPQFKGTGGYIQSLIMPAAEKKFYMETSHNSREWEDFWNHLWFRAKESIAASEEIHVVGYSLPEYDRRARELIFDASQKGSELLICCRSASRRLVDLFRNSGFGRSRSVGNGSFEDWLDVYGGRTDEMAGRI